MSCGGGMRRVGMWRVGRPFWSAYVFLFVSTTVIWDSCRAIMTHFTPVPLHAVSKRLIAEIRAKSRQSCTPAAGWGSGVYLWRSAVSRAKLWMTSSPVQLVPDRCITRLWHTQSGTRRGGVADLRLRAIQISCTPFHPLRCLSLALSSLWMSVLFLFFQLYLQPYFILFFCGHPW